MKFDALSTLVTGDSFNKLALAAATILLTLMFGLSGIASAEIIQDLTKTIGQTQCALYNLPCNADAGSSGSHASGNADFNNIPNTPWSYSFVTGPATAWHYDGSHYDALFDCSAQPCGSFTMNGPYGLTFGGQITTGESFSSAPGDYVHVHFEGYWSNGIYGWGQVDVESGIHSAADLQTFAQAPEPSSLLMLGSGALGLVGLLRRRLLG